jgi:hypothetical protein
MTGTGRPSWVEDAPPLELGPAGEELAVEPQTLEGDEADLAAAGESGADPLEVLHPAGSGDELAGEDDPAVSERVDGAD